MPPVTPRITRAMRSLCTRNQSPPMPALPASAACAQSHHRSWRVTMVRAAPDSSGRVGVLDLALGDLLEGHRQVVLRARLDERRQLFEGAFAELVVVVVDLPGTLGRHDHERVAAVHVAEQLVDAWLDHVAM